jgi:hypothetical protein
MPSAPQVLTQTSSISPHPHHSPQPGPLYSPLLNAVRSPSVDRNLFDFPTFHPPQIHMTNNRLRSTLIPW